MHNLLLLFALRQYQISGSRSLGVNIKSVHAIGTGTPDRFLIYDGD